VYPSSGLGASASVSGSISGQGSCTLPSSPGRPPAGGPPLADLPAGVPMAGCVALGVPGPGGLAAGMAVLGTVLPGPA
jgi:hypothetical protein